MNIRDSILYEDNHIIVINKKAGELVQADTEGTYALEDGVKDFIKVRDKKPGAVFLGVVHRIDRPVSGAVIFAKTSKALARLNEMVKQRQVTKVYWAVVEEIPAQTEGELRHYITRDPKNNRSKALDRPAEGAKEAILRYKLAASSANYHLLEIELITGRHHQIRAQLSKVGCPIRGDLKYGASRSLPGGGISLHSRRLEFAHPVGGKPVRITAPAPKSDNLWKFFEETRHGS